ncbi:MAG: PD-(D/E)XK nuclease domain-containing protein, partial [Desulfovibrio sp.]|nr:PD-(D/E)XK nuclease domain-containing protein [Desulfovibrio sp.]
NDKFSASARESQRLCLNSAKNTTSPFPVPFSHAAARRWHPGSRRGSFCRGRSDVLVEGSDRILLIEFKLAAFHKKLAAKRREGERQIRDAGYLKPYATASLPVSHAVFVINAETRQASL